MQSVDCTTCHWGSDERNGMIYCYWSAKKHEPGDCCRNYSDRLVDARTGKEITRDAKP